MKKIVHYLFLVCLFSYTATTACAWSDEEQEIIDYVTSAWDAWMEAVEKNDPEIWVKKANIDQNYSMWWTDDGVPRGLNTVKRDWKSICDTDLGWVDIRPVAIRVFDDVAFIQFYGYWKAKTPDGPKTTEYKRTEIFRKVNGGWSFIGGQGTPVSREDAEPYE